MTLGEMASSRSGDSGGSPSAPPIPSLEVDSLDGRFPAGSGGAAGGDLRASLQGGSVLIRLSPRSRHSLQEAAEAAAGRGRQPAATPGPSSSPAVAGPPQGSPSMAAAGAAAAPSAGPSPWPSPSKPLLCPSEPSHSALCPEASRVGIDAGEPVRGAGVTAYITISSGTQVGEKLGDKPPTARPSRTAALRRRHALQLHQHDKDQFGVPVAATARPFSIWAPPQKIGEACTGLGIHFASVRAFVLAALLLSLVAIYPLVSDLKTDRWQGSYRLVLDETTVASCEKPWVTHNWLTSATIGGHCASQRYSSGFECAATCTASSARLAQPQCAGQAWRGTGANASQACALHRPCAAGVTDPASPFGPCHCCDLGLDVAAIEANPEVPAAQLWTFLVGQLLFLLWLLFLARMQLEAIHKVDARVITASDYTVLIQGVPPSTTDAQLQEWCCHYGPVAMAASIPSFGSALKVGGAVRRLQIRKAEADARLHEECPPAPWLLRPWGWLYWGAVVGSRRRLQQRLEAQKHKLEVYQRQEFENTGAALAVFCYGEHAHNCVVDHHRPLPRRLLDSLSALPYCCCLAFCATRHPRLGGAAVTVTRAPEPSDFIWEHTSVTGARAAGRRLWSWTLTALVILAGLGLQYGLAVVAEQERKKRVNSQVLGGQYAEEALDFTSWGAFTSSAWQATSLRWIALVTGCTVVVVNWTITLVVRRLSVYERWHTRTSLERWTAVKLTLFYLMNSFAVPVLAAYLSSNTSSWYSRGGLLESAFWTQAANAVLPPLVNLAGPSNLLFFHLLARFAKTQAMLNWLMEPPEFPLAEQYASAVATLGMGVWYMPVLPMSPMIAAVGLFLAYWADKWVALRRAAHPGNLNGQVTSAAVDVIVRLLPLVQLVLMRELYFKGYASMVPVFWTGLALWLLFALAPFKRLLGMVRHARNTATGGLSYQETLAGGQRGGLDDVYMPEVPPDCSQSFRREATAVFALPPEPLPAVEAPLPHQRPGTGGAATRPPQLRASSAFAPGTLRAAASQGVISLEASYSTGLPEGSPTRLARALAAAAGSPASCAVSIEALGVAPPAGKAGAAGMAARPSAVAMAAAAVAVPVQPEPLPGLPVSAAPAALLQQDLEEGPLARGSLQEGPLARSARRLLRESTEGSLAGAASPPLSAGAGAGPHTAPRHVRGESAAWLRETAAWLWDQRPAASLAAHGHSGSQQQSPPPPPPLAPGPPSEHRYRQWRWGGSVAAAGVSVSLYGETSQGEVAPLPAQQPAPQLHHPPPPQQQGSPPLWRP